MPGYRRSQLLALVMLTGHLVTSTTHTYTLFRFFFSCARRQGDFSSLFAALYTLLFFIHPTSLVPSLTTNVYSF